MTGRGGVRLGKGWKVLVQPHKMGLRESESKTQAGCSSQAQALSWGLADGLG